MVSSGEVVLTVSPVVSLQVRARGFQTSSATTGHSWYLWMAVSSTRWPCRRQRGHRAWSADTFEMVVHLAP